MEPTLTPRPGKDYKNKKEVLAAFDAGEEFMATSMSPPFSGYTTKEELVRLGVERVMFRYKKLTQALPHKF